MTLADIWREKITCIIHTSTQEEADMLFKAVDSYDHNGTTWASWWNVYKEKTCYRTNLGEVVAYGHMDNYINDGEKVIEFSDLVATGGYSFTKKEEKKMSTKFTFYVTEGYRIDKSNNTKIPTMTTEVLVNGKDYQYGGSATCDKTDYEEREGVLNAIANAVCGGNFDRDFNKVMKNKAFANKKSRTCTYCGQVFDTVAEKEAHEAWHVERRKARHERYLLRKRAKEIAFEEAAQKMAKEMMGEQK